MPSETVEYYLPEHVFLCVVDGMIIFLDLQNDTYLSPEPDNMNIFFSILADIPERFSVSEMSMIKWHAEKLDRKNYRDDTTVNDGFAYLIKQQLLTTDAFVGKKIAPVTVNIPQLDLSGYDFGETPTIKAGHIFKFFVASLFTSIKLRFTPTERVVKSVRDRKRKQQFSVHSQQDEIRDLVEIFKILRPLFFTSKDNCLFDSLALINFLAGYGIYPTWVFGVKVRPFCAHCWVQDGNFIYNESLQNAHHFTPIMTV
jgi:hypothetical protein